MNSTGYNLLRKDLQVTENSIRAFNSTSKVKANKLGHNSLKQIDYNFVQDTKKNSEVYIEDQEMVLEN